MRRFWFAAVLLWPTLMFAEGWEWQYPLPQGNSLSHVDMVDDQTVWAAGGGTVVRTTDGGASWNVSALDVLFTITALQALDDQRCRVVGQWWFNGDHRVKLYATEDGGQTWENRLEVPNGNAFDLDLVDASNGWVAGYAASFGCLFHTLDGGAHWDTLYFDTSIAYLIFRAVDFVDAQHGWASANNQSSTYRLYRTSDGGATWDSLALPLGMHLNQLQFFDTLTGWAAGPDGPYRTTDAGQTWTAHPLPVEEGYCRSIHFVSPDSGWALDGAGYVFRTTDGGNIWDVLPTDFDGKLEGLDFVTGETGMAVGHNGLLLRTENSGQAWTLQGGALESSQLTSVVFADTLRGWVTGSSDDGGLLLMTEDGGQHWQINENAPPDLQKLCVLDARHLWGGSTNGTAYSSADGGQSWEPHGIGIAGYHEAVCFVDTLTGWVLYGSVENQLVHTTDGGATWTEQTVGPALALRDVAFVDASTGWVVTGEDYEPGRVFKSTDGGDTWTEQLSDPHAIFTACSFVSLTTGWALNLFGYVQKTTDGGASWTVQRFSEWDDYTAFQFIDEQYGFVIDNEAHNLYRTCDGGDTWTCEWTGIGYGGWNYDLSFVDWEHGWVVGQNAIVHYTGSASGVEPPPAAVPVSVSLAAFPNPFNPSTRITFELPVRSVISLRVFDLTGRLVTTLAEGTREAGSYTQAFDGAALASGVYFARLESAGFVRTQKLVLLR